MKTRLWKRMFAALLAVCLMVATTATGAFAIGTRTKGLTQIAEDTAATAGFDLSAYAEKLTDLLDVELTGDVAADVGTLLSNAKLYNVLIVGVDSRRNDYAGRSDAMVVLTVNPLSQKVVMTSLLRDSYVDIPGHGQERLNEAYNLGGTSLLKKTIRQNYGIRIDAFMVVNFGDLIEFVDDIGGVEMTVTKKEVPVINKYTSDQNKEIYGRKDNPDALPVKGGTYRFNGMQALAYARVRYVGLDFGRTERQRKVLSAAVKQLLSLPVDKQVQVIAKYMLRVKTDLTVPELLYLILVFATLDQYETSSIALPVEGTYKYQRVNGKEVIAVDLAANRAAWTAAVN
ncbi:MAG: LCP family protein [Clostridia bacterium]|nr:LCP family protein [Clostridia bacterium]MBQ2567287.1 LCP family protein [Clostridia bacterium]MBQ4459186.1 LCP family protein [Clostridia bacterium]MBQ6445352.1 LCP family protein [Clostridia bacterium]